MEWETLWQMRWTTREACKVAGVSLGTLNQRIKEKRLDAILKRHTPGTRRLFSTRQVYLLRLIEELS
jgi:hypothetical protein